MRVVCRESIADNLEFGYIAHLKINQATAAAYYARAGVAPPPAVLAKLTQGMQMDPPQPQSQPQSHSGHSGYAPVHPHAYAPLPTYADAAEVAVGVVVDKDTPTSHTAMER